MPNRLSNRAALVAVLTAFCVGLLASLALRPAARGADSTGGSSRFFPLPNRAAALDSVQYAAARALSTSKYRSPSSSGLFLPAMAKTVPQARRSRHPVALAPVTTAIT